MPIYEFRCRACGQKTSLFLRSIGDPQPPSCPQCGGREMERLISGFAYHKSERSRLEEAGSPDTPGPDYYKDPGNIGRWAEKRLQEMGMEVPPKIREMIGKAREGEVDEILEKRGLD